jgi:tRNA(Ile)-lysidine synthase TilS/MesJ
MTLAALSKEYFQSLVAVTVDHGLREESADEAAVVKSMVQELGMQISPSCLTNIV